jgi:hypothetical protein
MQHRFFSMSLQSRIVEVLQYSTLGTKLRFLVLSSSFFPYSLILILSFLGCSASASEPNNFVANKTYNAHDDKVHLYNHRHTPFGTISFVFFFSFPKTDVQSRFQEKMKAAFHVHVVSTVQNQLPKIACNG